MSRANANELLDTRGFFCPTPLILVSRRLKRLPPGAKVKVLSDDKGFANDIQDWARATGNRLLRLEERQGCFEAILERGTGFKGQNLWEKISFLALGVKLHIFKILVSLLPFKKPNYLLTFISVPEGLKADEWLKEKGITDYVLLPVPREIYPHCGVVIGTKTKEVAEDIYKLLKSHKFAVEDLHLVDRRKTYPKIELPSEHDRG